MTPAEIGTAIASFVAMRARGEWPRVVEVAWEPVEQQLDELRRCDEEFKRAMRSLEAWPHGAQLEREVAGILEDRVRRNPVVREHLKPDLKIVNAKLERARAERDPVAPVVSENVLHLAFAVGRGRVPPALDSDRSRDSNRSRDRER